MQPDHDPTVASAPSPVPAPVRQPRKERAKTDRWTRWNLED